MNKIDWHKMKFPKKPLTYIIEKTVGKEGLLIELIDDSYSLLMSERIIRENSNLLINFDNYNLKFLVPE